MCVCVCVLEVKVAVAYPVACGRTVVELFVEPSEPFYLTHTNTIPPNPPIPPHSSPFVFFLLKVELVLECWDWDNLTADDIIGETTVTWNLCSSSKWEANLYVPRKKESKKERKKAGRLEVRTLLPCA